MSSWCTELSLKLPNNNDDDNTNTRTRSNEEIRTEKLYLKNGIYQGDSLSSLWFCLAMNPISYQLNSHPYGYKLNKSDDSRITHLFYMDDLKVYAQNENQLQSQLEIISNVSSDIGMSLGLEKCNVLNIKHGLRKPPKERSSPTALGNLDSIRLKSHTRLNTVCQV
ncbi:hypothetical protein M8J76_014690 [Diaphorina citri]|nr:hypothetical protein M8J76_014690 [Diaphorina citri]